MSTSGFSNKKESSDYSSWRFIGNLINVYKYLKESGLCQALFGRAQLQLKVQQTPIETWEDLSESKEASCEGAWEVKQTAQRSCGVTCPGDIEKTPQYIPDQPVLGDGGICRS